MTENSCRCPMCHIVGAVTIDLVGDDTQCSTTGCPFTMTREELFDAMARQFRRVVQRQSLSEIPPGYYGSSIAARLEAPEVDYATALQDAPTFDQMWAKMAELGIARE